MRTLFAFHAPHSVVIPPNCTGARPLTFSTSLYAIPSFKSSLPLCFRQIAVSDTEYEFRGEERLFPVR